MGKKILQMIAVAGILLGLGQAELQAAKYWCEDCTNIATEGMNNCLKLIPLPHKDDDPRVKKCKTYNYTQGLHFCQTACVNCNGYPEWRQLHRPDAWWTGHWDTDKNICMCGYHHWPQHACTGP